MLDLTTNEHQPLLGAVGAILGICEGGLDAEHSILVFASREIGTVLCLGFQTGKASGSLNVDV